ncbi:hypothetical protein JW905_02805 [bacterium]|nr:hypothetical protein [candidate division CSSED10-310 bacterium]
MMRRHALALILVLLVLFLHVLTFWAYTVEDSYISFRYARNWATGNGLVYNVGDRVEGFSNFSWVILAGLMYRLDFDAPMVMKRAGVLLGIAAAVLMVLLAPAAASWPVRLAAPIWLAGSSAFCLWTVAGLETPLFTFLLVLAWVLAVRCPSRRGAMSAGVVFGLAGLTRPEAPLYVLLFGAGVLCGQPSRRGLLRWVLLALGFCMVFIPFLCFRYSYFGDIVPNTYYVKSVRFQGGGVRYLWRALPFTGVLPFLLAPFGLGRGSRAWRTGLAATVLGVVAYTLHQGGDWMPMGRFLVPVLPAVCLLGAHGLHRCAVRLERCSGGRPAARGLVAAALLFTCAWGMGSAKHNVLRWEIKLQKEWRLVGEWLRDNAPSGSAMATGLGGIIPYHAGLTNYDNGGLTDKRIAAIIRAAPNLDTERRRVDAYIMELAPRYFLIPNIIQLWDRPQLDLSALRWELLDNARFRSEYRLRNVQVAGRYFAYFEKRNGLNGGPMLTGAAAAGTGARLESAGAGG